jgi:hypothetical protein
MGEAEVTEGLPHFLMVDAAAEIEEVLLSWPAEP